MTNEQVRSNTSLILLALVTILLVLATTLASLFTSIAANLFTNLLQAGLPAKLDWVVVAFIFLLLSVGIRLLAVLINWILERRKSPPTIVTRWVWIFEIFGGGLYLSLILTRFCQLPFREILSGSNLAYIVFALLPLGASVVGAKIIQSAYDGTLEAVTKEIDALFKQGSQVQESALLAKSYPSLKDFSDEQHDVARMAMAAYVGPEHQREVVQPEEIIVLDIVSNPLDWALLRGPRTPKVVEETVLSGSSRDNQQWILIGEWLDTSDDVYYYLLQEMAQESEGLQPGAWRLLVLALEDLQRRKLEEFRRGKDDEIHGRAKGKYDLSSEEHHMLKRLEEILQHHPDPKVSKGIVLNPREMEDSEPIAWRLLAMIVDDLEEKDKLNKLNPEDRELLNQLKEVLTSHPEAKSLAGLKKSKADFEAEQRQEREKLLLNHWLDNGETNAYAELLTMAKSAKGLSKESWERISKRLEELRKKISDSGEVNRDGRLLLMRLEEILYFKDKPER